MTQNFFRYLIGLLSIFAVALVYTVVNVAKESSQNNSQSASNTNNIAVSTAYRQSAQIIMVPFFTAIKSIDTAQKAATNASSLLKLAEKAEYELLLLKVPSVDKDAHLNIVLLLEKWKRLLDGSSADFTGTTKKTTEIKRDYPWIVP